MGTMNQGMDGAPLDPGVEEHQMEQSLDAFFKEPVDDVKVRERLLCFDKVARLGSTD